MEDIVIKYEYKSYEDKYKESCMRNTSPIAGSIRKIHLASATSFATSLITGIITLV